MARLAVGRVVGAYANSGAIRVGWLGDGPDALLHATAIWLALDDEDEFPRRHAVEDARPGASGEVRLTVAGVRARADAESLQGRLVLMDRSELQPLGERQRRPAIHLGGFTQGIPGWQPLEAR